MRGSGGGSPQRNFGFQTIKNHAPVSLLLQKFTQMNKIKYSASTSAIGVVNCVWHNFDKLCDFPLRPCEQGDVQFKPIVLVPIRSRSVTTFVTETKTLLLILISYSQTTSKFIGNSTSRLGVVFYWWRSFGNGVEITEFEWQSLKSNVLYCRFPKFCVKELCPPCGSISFAWQSLFLVFLSLRPRLLPRRYNFSEET